MICPLGKLLKSAFLDEEKSALSFCLFLSSSFPSFLPFFYYLIDFFSPVHSERFYADRHCDAPRLHLAEQEAGVWPWGLTSQVGGQTRGEVLFSRVLLQKVSLSGDRLQDSGPGPGLAVPGQRWGGELSRRTLGFTPSAAGHQRGALKREPCESPRLFLQSADC